jgi:hypothetical protein
LAFMTAKQWAPERETIHKIPEDDTDLSQ